MTETIQIKTIRIEWDGPFRLVDLAKSKLNDITRDYGVYQVYGHHPIYGNNVLLYIGKAEQQTFATRLLQEEWELNEDSQNIQIYVGRLFARKQPNNEEWDSMIDKAERMLIYAHEPAKNSSNIRTITRNKELLKEFENIRILNYDHYRSLMPEISGELWIKTFEDYNDVFIYEQD